MPKLLSYYYNLNIDDYFRAFTRTRKKKNRDVTPFVSFVCDGVAASLQHAGDEFIRYINVALPEDYYQTLREKR